MIGLLKFDKVKIPRWLKFELFDIQKVKRLSIRASGIDIRGDKKKAQTYT